MPRVPAESARKPVKPTRKQAKPRLTVSTPTALRPLSNGAEHLGRPIQVLFPRAYAGQQGKIVRAQLGQDAKGLGCVFFDLELDGVILLNASRFDFTRLN